MARTLADVPALLLAKSAGFGEDECWPWPGAKNDKGYGQIRIGGKLYYVHILSCEAFNGPIPEGFEVDHRCHNPRNCIGGPQCPHRPCFNFRHLKAVTSAENSERSVSRARPRCPQNHEYTKANTYIAPNGRRFCRKCHSARVTAAKKAKREARGPIPPRTRCRNGHAINEANTYINAAGQRRCRVCKREHMAAVRSARKVAA